MKFIFFVLLLFCGSVVCAQTERLLTSNYTDGYLSIQTTKGKYTIHYFNEKAIETSFSLTDFSEKLSSHAVVEKTFSFKFKANRESNQTVVYSVLNSQKLGNTISIAIDSVPFNITYYYGDKRLISQRENSSEPSKFKLDFAISSIKYFI